MLNPIHQYPVKVLQILLRTEKQKDLIAGQHFQEEVLMNKTWRPVTFNMMEQDNAPGQLLAITVIFGILRKMQTERIS